MWFCGQKKKKNSRLLKKKKKVLAIRIGLSPKKKLHRIELAKQIASAVVEEIHFFLFFLYNNFALSLAALCSTRNAAGRAEKIERGSFNFFSQALERNFPGRSHDFFGRRSF